MKILDYKDAINRRLYNNQSFILTAIHRVSCLNQTVLGTHLDTRKKADTIDNEDRRYLHKIYVLNLVRQQLLAAGNRWKTNTN